MRRRVRIGRTRTGASVRVTIVMPTLNQATFIEAAIDSVLGQTWTDLELIVADGGSTDGTLDILKRRQTQDARLQWFSEKDTGPASALNKAILMGRGTIIGWLNSDDLYTPGAIGRAVNALQTNPVWVLVYGHGQHVDAAGEVIDAYPTKLPHTPIEQFADGCFICQPTVFFKRTMYLLLGKLDESLKTAFDFDYWLRAFLAFPGRIGFVNAVQAQSRQPRRDVSLEGASLLTAHLGHAPTHWPLTYAEGLIATTDETDASVDLSTHRAAALQETPSCLGPEVYQQLEHRCVQDEQLDRSPLLTPKENAALAMEEYKAGVLKVRSTPRLLTLETTSRCNLRCVMCPHAINAVKRPKHLDEVLVQRMTRFIRQANSIQLHGIGEPLASPSFWTLLPMLPDARHCESSINTNLTLLDDNRLERLLDSNLKIVNVSLDAARPETYRKIRGYDFAKVLNNVERLLEGRQKRNQPYPLVYLNMTLMRSNIEEVLEFIELAAQLQVDKVLLWHLNRWSDQEMAKYVVAREGWVFDYAREGLWNEPALSNSILRQAELKAKELNVRLQLDHNKAVYFDEFEEAA